MDILFSPLLAFLTPNLMALGATVVTVVVATIWILIWAGFLVRAYVFEDKPAVWLETLKETSILEEQYLEDAIVDGVGSALFFALGVVIFWMAVFSLGLALNWLWFPSSILAGLYCVLRVARKVVRINRALDAHKSDPKAHTTPPGDE